ncbi:MAG: acyl-CoA dehydrogenase family protein [Chloroflexi bacterium]|nr:acyl-CoA dehydrogenase family protein [Chloroflexota bacterium]
MDFKLTPEQEVKRKEYYKVCAELLKKRPAAFVGGEGKLDNDESWEYHRYCAREFGKRGWLTFGWPKEWGGQGDMMDKVLFSEAVGYYGLPGVDEFGVAMLAPTLLAAASDEVKKKFLPGIASGEVMWCELWSEPNAGSDLAALTTTAIKKCDDYIVNGQKTWNTAAHRADWAFGV